MRFSLFILKILYQLTWMTLAALTVVNPNAAKVICVVALFLLAVKYTVEFHFSILKHKYFLYLTLSVPVTILHIGIGLMNGAPFEAATQVAFIYIISPYLWGIVSIGALKEYGISKIASTLVVCLFFAILTEVYYFVAFVKYGPESVTFLVEQPNVDISDDGHSAAVMCVFGSMIFLIGGIISSPEVITSKFWRGILVISSIAAALTSGRSGLILALILGLLVNLVDSVLNRAALMEHGKKIINLIIIFLMFTTILYFFSEYMGINLFLNIDELFFKLANRGGEGRNQQTYMFIDGVLKNYGLGAGHGIGLDYRVSDRYPWRYEMIWLASLYRVGILGALMYALPFVIVLFSAGRSLIRGHLNSDEKFIFGGFLCSFVASNTNPYIEAFVFQWMYVFPIVYFTTSWRRNTGSVTLVERRTTPPA